jgi:hypothetical protein
VARKIGFRGGFAAVFELAVFELVVVELFAFWASATEKTKSSNETAKSVFLIWSFFSGDAQMRDLTELLAKRRDHTDSPKEFNRWSLEAGNR